jgi:uncharacterized membrane protein YfcA
MISLLQFDAPILLAVIGVILLSGLVHGTLGLGFPMVATPMLATMMDVRSAILITLLPTMAVNIVSIVNSESRMETTRRFLPLVMFSLLGTVAGASVLALTEPAPFRILLAALVLLYLWNGLRIPRQWLERNSLLAMALFGISAGIAAGTTNVMVAVLIVYFLSLETPRSTLVPALNSCFLVGKTSQIVVLAIAGLVPGDDLPGNSAQAAIGAGDCFDLSIPGRGRDDRLDRGTLKSYPQGVRKHSKFQD